jgi:hypothetical protein
VSLIVDEHRQYLRDGSRVSAFDAAVHETVRPGDVVLDLGSGTGILGMLACRAGAKRVYSIEQTGMIELARAMCRANGFENRVVFIKEHSTRVELPEKVDVAICDQIGRFGFEAGVNQFFDDVRRRSLKPGGKLLPSRIDLFVSPVECPAVWDDIEFWNQSPAGFDFAPARAWAANTGYPVKLSAEQLLGDAAKLCTFDVTQVMPRTVRADVETRVSKSGMLHGIGGWFSAQLSPSVVLSNSPSSSQSIDRRNVFFPIDGPVKVEPGDRVQIQMSIMPKEVMVSWRVRVFGAQRQTDGAAARPKAESLHSTFGGMLLSKEDLVRTQPDFVPKLTPWGKARGSILELCDGIRSLSDLEREVYRRHPDLFASEAEAAGFVAEVITAYAG